MNKIASKQDLLNKKELLNVLLLAFEKGKKSPSVTEKEFVEFIKKSIQS